MAEKSQYRLLLTGREALDINGVKSVCGFDDSYVRLDTALGELLIKGEALNIDALMLDRGEIKLSGKVFSMQYSEGKGNSQGKKALKRLLK